MTRAAGWFNSYAGMYLLVIPTGVEFENDLRLYDTEAKARSVAKTTYHDTGKLCQVYKLVTP